MVYGLKASKEQVKSDSPEVLVVLEALRVPGEEGCSVGVFGKFLLSGKNRKSMEEELWKKTNGRKIMEED